MPYVDGGEYATPPGAQTDTPSSASYVLDSGRRSILPTS